MEARADHSGDKPVRRIGRYELFGEIASGGMATVYFGRLAGAVGFSRSVAIKQLHPQYAKSPEFVAQFLDEAQLASRVRHPNVVSVLDVVAGDGELFVVMEFVEGEPLARLVRNAKEPVPLPVASALLIQVLLGLHAAHEATTETGEPLFIVHRDVSPQNILVGLDGTSHVLDFGVAKAASRLHTTETGQIKGKLTYMAPEQLLSDPVDRRADVFAAGIVLWELLTGQQLFARSDPGATVTAVLSGMIKEPSHYRPEISPKLDKLVMKALTHTPAGRFSSAREMAVALEACVPPASSLTVGAWVSSIAGDSLRERAERLREAEEHTGVSVVTNVAALQRRLSDAALPGSPEHVRSSYPDRESSWVVRRRRAWLPWAVAGALALLLGAGAFFVGARKPALAPAPVVLTAPAKAPEIATNVAHAPLAGTSAPSPAEPPAAAPSARVAPRTWKRVSKPSASASAAPDNCKPPYVLDAQGRKRFKPECF